jgi:ABC-type phosphate/phosphonate transport system substrate-binding protein
MARLLIHAALVLVAASAALTATAQEFVFGVNEGVTYHVTVLETRERYKGLTEAIAKALKRPVKLVPVDQYPALRKGLESTAYDLAYVHPTHHALRAMRDQGYRLVAVTKGYTGYKARFMARKEAPYKDPKEIQGQKIVMPDPDSITAWLARAVMRDLGLDPAKEELGSTRYQDRIQFMTDNGFFDIGVTADATIVKKWQDQGARVLIESRPVPIKLLIASPRVASANVEKLRTLFLNLDQTREGQEALARIGFKGFEPGDEKQLDEIGHWLGI